VTNDEQPEQTTPQTRAAHRADAQTRAYTWAERAENHHVKALGADADVRTLSGKGYVTRDLDRARLEVVTHTERSDRAARMAEMWARIAQALTT
jgi:hypothetical protein